MTKVRNILLFSGLGIVALAIGTAQGNRPSPPATAEVSLAGKQIVIKYSRPSMRGRKIMGGLVPYGQVWRTGANEATELTTPAALRIGSADVPAGKYTLWTLPSESGWKLIINKQTGQWGTEYDASQDLIRVDMHRTSLIQPVEEFLISWKKLNDKTADLVIEWETTRVSVPVEAR